MPVDDVVHALRRLTFGPTPELVADVRRRGIRAFLDEQLAPDRLDDGELDGFLRGFASVSRDAVALRQHVGGDIGLAAADHQGASIARAVWSRRQLLEVMVDLWSDHLNVPLTMNLVTLHRPSFDRTVLRPHALGRFEDMLVASARHPAMLVYLDAARSRAPHPNQNYGRELLELHTLGTGFGEADVVAASDVFSGWTLTADLASFAFRPDWHRQGAKSVAGWSTPGRAGTAGVDEGVDLLRHLARHPATAQNVARRICTRLVADDPPAALVRSAAAVYLRNGTAIAPVVRHVVGSSAFGSSEGRKVKRPLDLVASAARALGLRPADGARPDVLRDLLRALRSLGQAPHAWPAPDGYPDDAASWVGAGALVTRWNTAGLLAGGAGLRRPPLAALVPDPSRLGPLLDGLGSRLLQRPLTAAERSTLLSHGGGGERSLVAERTAWALAALVVASPGFQVR